MNAIQPNKTLAFMKACREACLVNGTAHLAGLAKSFKVDCGLPRSMVEAGLLELNGNGYKWIGGEPTADIAATIRERRAKSNHALRLGSTQPESQMDRIERKMDKLLAMWESKPQ